MSKNEELISLKEVQELLKKQEQHIIQNFQLMQFRQGPTPPPDELKELAEIDKTFPDRIIRMAEKEQSFRHKVTYIGPINFILLVLFGFSIAGVVGYYGSEIVGSVIATGVSYIAYVFKSKAPEAPNNKGQK